jgi:two-component system cell cycle sensor histidine kinase/response regulator CckA
MTPFRPPPQPPPDRPLPGWLLAGWVVTGIALLILAVLSIRRETRTAREEWESRLSRLAEDRAGIAEEAFRAWCQEARLLARLPGVRTLAASGPRAPAQETASARTALEELAAAEEAMAIGVVDRGGLVVAASTDPGSFEAARLEPARRAAAERRTIVVHSPGPAPDTVALLIAEPIPGEDGIAEGSVLLAIDAPRALGRHFPPTPSGPAEQFFLVVDAGNTVLVVSPGRPSASYRLPSSDRASFAAAAVRNPHAEGEFTDGRGHRVLAATRRVPELGWGVAVDVDREEALAVHRQQVLWILAAVAGLFTAITGFGLAWRRALRVHHYQQLAERDAHYRTLLEQTQDAVSVTVDGLVTYANPACVQMFGYDRPLIGAPISTFFASGSREQVAEISRHRALGNPAPELYEAIGQRADGSSFDVELRVTPVEFEGKAGFQAILRDITARKRMEAELRGSEEKYRLLFERNLAGVYRSTVDGRLLECNRAFARMMGYASPAEAMAQPSAAFHPDARSRQEFIERLRREGNLLAFETQGRRKDGTLIWLIENVSLLKSEDGEETLLGTVFDMTERRRLEEQLLQSQKMEAVGRLAGGIAHDFNNLLTAVAGYTELLLGELPPGDPRRESAEEIRQAGKRAAALTQQLLAFSRRQVLEPRVLDLNLVIANMERLLRRVIGEDVELTTSLHPDLWRTRADPGQIEQVILNLVVNARDAMPRGGRLTLETQNVELDDKFAGRYASVQPGPHVMLAVSDTGLGMDPELQSRLFEPFFTTKERGKGTGLGLSTTYGVVKQSGGSIWVYSEPGHGTTFKIYLPRCEEPLDRPIAPAAPAEPLGGTETVLLVEDEPEVRRLVEKLLVMKGYDVLSAASPADAISVSRNHEGAIHVLVTDVVMPGMNGRELARALAPARPEMRVLYMSGYTDAAVTRHGLLEPGTAFLSKPFTPDALARKLREVLEAPGPSVKSS